MGMAIRNAWAKLVLSLPHNKRRWNTYMQYYEPILAFAQEIDMHGRLLTLRAMDTISRREPSARASKRLYQLHFHCPEDNLHARALYNSLCGMYAALRGNKDEMAKRFRLATKFGHTFHLIYVNLGVYYLFERHQFDRAEGYLNQAIDCIYKYPPLNEEKRLAIAAIQSHIAYAMIMMQRIDEAELLLAKSTVAEGRQEYHHALAMLRAVQGRPTEAHAALEAPRPLHEELWTLCKQNVRLILDGKHPHFTALPMGTPEAINDFWQLFLAKEEDMMYLLRNDRRSDARALIAGPLNEMDPFDSDYWGFGVSMEKEEYTFSVASKYSRTYTLFVDALLAACPPELHERWHITRNP